MNPQRSRMAMVQSPIIPVVGELIRQHPGTISLGQGVVSYGPPPEALAQIAPFLSQPDNHKYKAVQGILPLIEAIVHKLKSENQITLADPRQVVVTAGSNMAFMNGILAITQPGDEIILPTPYYFNHEMAIAMAGCRAICVPTDDQYQLQIEAMTAAITPKTRAIVTISPNNPTGAMYPAPVLQQVNQLCRDHNLYHISDEAYEYFTAGGVSHTSPARFDPGCQHTISLFTLSKAYGFASWRIGYMAFPDHLSDAILKIQDTLLICPPVICQYAALGALQAGRAYCEKQGSEIATIRQTVLDQLAELADICTIPSPQGSFYVLLKVHTTQTDMELVEQLIRTYGVAVIPGCTFGMAQGCYLRVAYGALQADTVKTGIGRLVHGLQTIVST
ncbi:pyridoxal phosphate-dependent aminotransferase [Synechococcales cyanobacterium C]|uniref:Pyridoxal phosphate-dependent aminotransferase n=1 Tax=Petrachloros mirabilis ULC683 TaxID=2781853 RepID=A0A8K2A2M7_9CYAN|nr:pyridoxal phosphate-dependent aminotransferase [Petrachloros mirabilis]NCJ08696.1 pyridoxal phosphate-dependent aminotransferase [Petrachloros mirabilis ULC683]